MKLLAVAATLALLAATADAALKKITARGVDGVKLHATYQHLRSAHLIGHIRPGCELGGPNTRSAALRAPLKGSVDFTLSSPRRVTDIAVTKGAAAKGVGIGATIAQIKAKFPHAKVDHTTDGTFLITLVKVPKRDGGRFIFGVDTHTHKTTIIGIPHIAFCE